jgi:5-methyltetrahydrofolate--homocysteine methyltransferase
LQFIFKEYFVLDWKALNQAVLEGDRIRTEELTRQALGEKQDPKDIIRQGLLTAMAEVGEKFSQGDLFVPEMLMSAKAMKAALAILEPLLKGTGYEPAGKVVLGTVKGDLHDIGKNLVKIMLEGAGFEVIDLGVDAGPEKFVAAVQQHRPKLVAMSALLTTTMLAMPETIQALDEAGLRTGIKVIIGGAAVTQKYADEIKADGYGVDASQAVVKSKQLIGMN